MGILIGFLATALTILFNIFAGSFLQHKFGTLGMALTEIGFALIALITAFAYLFWKRHDMQRRHIEYNEAELSIEGVFRFKLPKFRHILGGMFLMYAGYIISAMYYNIVMRVFPDAYAAVNNSILESAYTGTFAATFCTIALVPAVCEELVLRGAIQKTFEDLKKPIHTVLLAGFMFGLFHIDPIRIPFATMMGIILSYAYYRSKSIAVPILMHFANNAYSVISSWSLRDTDTAQIQQEASAALSDPMTASISALFTSALFIVVAISALYAGASFLETNFPQSVKEHRKVYIAAAGCVAALGIGMFLSILILGF